MYLTSISKFTVSVLFITSLSIPTWAQNINTRENFPDPEFRAAVETFMNVSAGGEFTAVEASSKTKTMKCSGQYKKASSLFHVGRG